MYGPCIINLKFTIKDALIFDRHLIVACGIWTIWLNLCMIFLCMDLYNSVWGSYYWVLLAFVIHTVIVFLFSEPYHPESENLNEVEKLQVSVQTQTTPIKLGPKPSDRGSSVAKKTTSDRSSSQRTVSALKKTSTPKRTGTTFLSK